MFERINSGYAWNYHACQYVNLYSFSASELYKNPTVDLFATFTSARSREEVFQFQRRACLAVEATGL